MFKPFSLLVGMQIVSLLLLSGCTSLETSNPARTATEQLLISTAAERAAMRLNPGLPVGSKIFIDSSNFEGVDSKNAIAIIRGRLVRSGLNMVNEKSAADVIVEIRAGALSIDRRSALVGIPSFSLPLPLASAPLTLPELALYSETDQAGVAQFALTAYDAKTGALRGVAQSPQFGVAHNIKHTALFFISWSQNEAEPPGEE